MIRSVSVKSFKSLVDVEVELGRVNVFIGANGSGKSNFLEAIGVLGAAAAGRVDDEALQRRGVRPGVPALYKSSFRGSRMRGSIRLQATAPGAAYAVELFNALRDPEPAWSFKNEKLSEGRVKVCGRSPASRETLDPKRGLAALKAVELRLERPARKLLDALGAFAIHSPSTHILRGLATEQREPVGLRGGRLPEAVAELLNASSGDETLDQACSSALGLIDWSTSFGSWPRSPNTPLSPSVASAKRLLVFGDKYMAEGRNLLTGYDASEGALYVLFACVLALHPKTPPILAIDNADHGLNPRLARALMAQVCEWVLAGPPDKQMLLTTHNPLVLDGLPLDNDEVRLFAVDRSRKGQTVIHRVKVDVEDLRKDGELWTVSRLWVMGHLGGVPDV